MGWLEASVCRLTPRFDTSIVGTPQMAAVFSALAKAFLTTLPLLVLPNPPSFLRSTTRPNSCSKALLKAAVLSATDKVLLDFELWRTWRLAYKQYGEGPQMLADQNEEVMLQIDVFPLTLAISGPLCHRCYICMCSGWLEQRQLCHQPLWGNPLNLISILGSSLRTNFSRLLISWFNLWFSAWIEAEFSEKKKKRYLKKWPKPNLAYLTYLSLIRSLCLH